MLRKPKLLSRLAVIALFALLYGCIGGGGSDDSGSGNGNSESTNGDSTEDEQNDLNGSVAAIEDIQIEAQSGNLPKYTKITLSAQAVYEDGGSKDVTNEADWSSSNPDIATVASHNDSPAVITGVEEGAVTINVEFEGKVGAAKITVTSPVLQSLDIQPKNKEIELGTTVNLQARGLYKGGIERNVTSMVDWSSENIEIVELEEGASDEYRTISALAVGTTNIEIRLDGLADTTGVVVNPAALTEIQITPSAETLEAGQLFQYEATGIFTDGSNKTFTSGVSWSSSHSALATIDDKGVISALEPGSLTISASQGEITHSVPLTVVSAPSAPRTLSIIASPNVILSDGNDSLTLEGKVLPNDPESNVVADGTSVVFSIDNASLHLSSRMEETVSGEFSISAESSGPPADIEVLAEVEETLARGKTKVTVVDDFSAAITSSQSVARLVIINGFYQPGVEFGYTISNSSNRTFELKEFEFLINEQTDLVTSDPELLGQNTLEGGETVSLTVTLNQSSQGPFAGLFKLNDAATATNFEVRLD